MNILMIPLVHKKRVCNDCHVADKALHGYDDSGQVKFTIV